MPSDEMTPGNPDPGADTPLPVTETAERAEGDERPFPTGESPRRKRRKWIILAVLLALLLLLAYVAVYFTANRRLPLPQVTPREAGIQAPQYLFSFAGSGAEGLMRRPIGIVVGRNNLVYVVDSGAKQIKAYDRAGTYKYTFGKVAGSSTASLGVPVHLALAPDQSVWVTDRRLQTVFVFDRDGKYLREFKPKVPIADFQPLAIAIDEDANVYVTDVGSTHEHQVRIFRPDGTEMLSFGRTAQVKGTEEQPGAFYFPNGLVVSGGEFAKREIYVSDGDNRRIQVFDTKGTFKRFVKTSGTPRGVALDPKERLYVVDALSQQVDIYSKQGARMVTFGEAGIGPAQFQFPNDIALDGAGRIYITDRENNQVQVWGFAAAEIPGITRIAPGQVPWCLALLPLLLLPLLFRRKRWVVTPDFVEALIAAESIRSLTTGRRRWVMEQGAHAAYVGRVVDGVDLGEVLKPEPYSTQDAAELARRFGVAIGTAGVLAMSKRYGRLCTEDVALAQLAVTLEVAVYDRQAFLEIDARARR